MSLELNIPQLSVIEAKLDAVLEGRVGQTWYTLEQAWRLKFAATAGAEGAISLRTLKNTLAMQPCGGIPDAWQSNRKVWREETIREWLEVGDDGLKAYLEKHNPRRRVPARIANKLATRASA